MGWAREKTFRNWGQMFNLEFEWGERSWILNLLIN